MSGHPNARYCTLKCQRNAAALRRRGRDATPILSDDRFYLVIRDPIVAQLESASKDILLELNNNKPILLLGNVPRWTPPKGVVLTDQHDDEGSFLMDKYVPDVMEMFKKS
jgi:hypothetical protein